MADERKKVVIVGGGFGGLYAARALRRAPVDVILVDKRNYHLFQPLLYQVATAGLSPANIASPLRSILVKQKNVRPILGEVTGIDAPGRRVLLGDGVLDYDMLILAAGSTHTYFGHDAWEPLAPPLKSMENALDICGRVLHAFEAAEQEADPGRRNALLTFVIAGGGATGVELAGALAEIKNDTLHHEFHSIDPRAARIILVESGPRLLPAFPEKLSRAAERSLRAMDVTVRKRERVQDIHADHVILQHESGNTVRIECRTVLWSAGVTASPLGAALEQAGAERDAQGRVRVGPCLTVPGYPEIFVIGDLALAMHHRTGRPLPGLAPVAMQQGKYVAAHIRARLRGHAVRPFRYIHFGSMAAIGRNSAVADFGILRFSGPLAWWAWLFAHLLTLVQFENRILVLTQWAFYYFSRNRSARLILEILRNTPAAQSRNHAADQSPSAADQMPPDAARTARKSGAVPRRKKRRA